MFTAATRVLRLAFDDHRTVPVEAEPAHDEPAPIDFVAYAADCLLAGVIRLDAARLTDLLNGSDEIELMDAVFHGLADGRVVEVERATLTRADLIAVKAGEPRGNEAQRRPTRQHPVALGAGPYAIHGYVHARAGVDPMIDLGRRPAMLPLTDAVIRYQAPTGWCSDLAGTLIVNRDAAEWMRPASEAEFSRLAASA